MVTRFVQPNNVSDVTHHDANVFINDRVLPFVTVSILQVVVFAVLLLSGLVLLSTPSVAQPTDMPRGQLIELLGQRYAEAPVAIGLSDIGAVVEVFAATDGSTWTMILTTPDGLSRVIQAGEAWIGMTSSSQFARQASATPQSH